MCHKAKLTWITAAVRFKVTQYRAGEAGGAQLSNAADIF